MVDKDFVRSFSSNRTLPLRNFCMSLIFCAEVGILDGFCDIAFGLKFENIEWGGITANNTATNAFSTCLRIGRLQRTARLSKGFLETAIWEMANWYISLS